MSFNLYIDESGNTGEAIVRSDELLNFSDQPIFVLGGFGLPLEEEKDVEAFIKKVKQKYRVQAPELKASLFYDKKPEMIYEIMNYLFQKKYPLFLELMDKKYYIIMQIATFSILPPVMLDIEDAPDLIMLVKHRLAEYLYRTLPAKMLFLYSKLSRNPDKEDFESWYVELKNYYSITNHPDEIRQHIQMSYDFYIRESKVNVLVYKQFMSPPDFNKAGGQVSLLPHANAFTNLIARMEKYLQDHKLSDIVIKHDKQKKYDQILLDNYDVLKDTIGTSNKILPVDAQARVASSINDDHNVTFIDSKSSSLMQISDLIVGIVMRSWQDFIEKKHINEIYFKLYKQIIFSYSDIHCSCGINLVVTKFAYMDFHKYLYGDRGQNVDALKV